MLGAMVGTAVPAIVLLAGCEQCVAPHPGPSGRPARRRGIEAAAPAPPGPATAPESTAAPTPPPTPATARPRPRPRRRRAPRGRMSTLGAGRWGSSRSRSPIPNVFAARFDHGWSGEVHAGSMFGDDANGWPADHDGSCGNPNETSRKIQLGDGESQAATAQAFYTCLPGGDPAKGHVMTSVNTEGYVVAWFSPKQTFTDVHKVCWDQNLTDLGGGKWTQVVFLTPDEIGKDSSDLGFTSPEFPHNGGPSSPRGESGFGVKMFEGGMVAWQDGAFTDDRCRAHDGRQGGPLPALRDRSGERSLGGVDRPARREGVDGRDRRFDPERPIRVVFEDDNYNPDKHFSATEAKDRDGRACTPGTGTTSRSADAHRERSDPAPVGGGSEGGVALVAVQRAGEAVRRVRAGALTKIAPAAVRGGWS